MLYLYCYLISNIKRYKYNFRYLSVVCITYLAIWVSKECIFCYIRFKIKKTPQIILVIRNSKTKSTYCLKIGRV